ncbi:MAG: hypothetical protein ABI607_14740 [Betaproteobacteria bacterium]
MPIHTPTCTLSRAHTTLRRFGLAVLVAVAATSPAADAQKFQPGSNYICPNSSDTGLDCYLDAVRHLYTMCRHIKSIEVIEFGYETAQQGVNGAKSEYCVDKQKINITRPYQAALTEVTPSKEAIDGLRTLQQLWLEALAGLKWQTGESDEDYKTRVARPYSAFVQWSESIRTAVATAPKSNPPKSNPPKSTASKAAAPKTAAPKAAAPKAKAATP